MELALALVFLEYKKGKYFPCFTLVLLYIFKLYLIFNYLFKYFVNIKINDKSLSVRWVSCDRFPSIVV